MHLPPARLFLLVLLFCVILIPLSALAAAPAREWTVEEVSGTVRIRDSSGLEMAGVRIGMAVVPPFSVQTGDDGRLVLGHGRDRVTASPGTRFEVPEPQQEDGDLIDRFLQTLGSMLYQVEHRVKGGFEVETPYLVSVVKGTTFNILVTADTSTVALVEGLLAVYSPDGKSQLLLKPGQAAIKSMQSDRILLKDQQSLTAPMTGPIRVVDNAGSGGIRGAAGADTIDLGIGPVATSVSLDTAGGSIAALEVGAANTGVEAALRVDGGMIDLGLGSDGTVSVSEAAISLDADVPGVDVGTVSVDVGGASVSVGAVPQIDVGTISVDVGATAVGSIGIDTTSIDLGEVVISGGAVPMIDVSGTSVDVGEVSLGDIATPSLGLDASLGIDASSGANAALDLAIGDTSVVNLDVTGTGVSVDVSPENVVTTVNNAVSDTAGAAVGIIRGLPGL